MRIETILLSLSLLLAASACRAGGPNTADAGAQTSLQTPDAGAAPTADSGVTRITRVEIVDRYALREVSAPDATTFAFTGETRPNIKLVVDGRTYASWQRVREPRRAQFHPGGLVHDLPPVWAIRVHRQGWAAVAVKGELEYETWDDLDPTRVLLAHGGVFYVGHEEGLMFLPVPLLAFDGPHCFRIVSSHPERWTYCGDRWLLDSAPPGSVHVARLACDGSGTPMHFGLNKRAGDNLATVYWVPTVAGLYELRDRRGKIEIDHVSGACPKPGGNKE